MEFLLNPGCKSSRPNLLSRKLMMENNCRPHINVKIDIINLAFEYLVRMTGVVIALFTLYGLYVLYVFGLGTSPFWVQAISFLITVFCILLLLPLWILHRNHLVRHTYVGLGIFYILFICAVVVISIAESRSIVTLENLLSIPVIIAVSLHIKFIRKMANQSSEPTC